MKRISLLLGVLCVCNCAVSAQGEDMTEISQKSVEDSGISLSLSVPKESAAGGELLASITLTNAGSEKLFYTHVSKYRNFKIVVKDAEGDPIPMTRFGKKILITVPAVR